MICYILFAIVCALCILQSGRSECQKFRLLLVETDKQESKERKKEMEVNKQQDDKNVFGIEEVSESELIWTHIPQENIHQPNMNSTRTNKIENKFWNDYVVRQWVNAFIFCKTSNNNQSCHLIQTQQHQPRQPGKIAALHFLKRIFDLEFYWKVAIWFALTAEREMMWTSLNDGFLFYFAFVFPLLH